MKREIHYAVFSNLLANRIIFVSKPAMGLQKDFNLKWNRRKEESHTCTLRKSKLGDWETDPQKCLIYRGSKLISTPASICQGSLPTLEPMSSLCGPWVSPFVLLAYKSSPPFTLTGLSYSSLQFACPQLQFLCYSQVNSNSGNLSLPQFTSF